MPQRAVGDTNTKLLEQFRSSTLIALEDKLFAEKCPCSRQVEEYRAELHHRNDKVLVVDQRFFYNGVGNSLVRWIAWLRYGIAAGRATYIWRSDDFRAVNDRIVPIDLQIPGHTRGIDLGYYFRTVGANFRWYWKTRQDVVRKMRSLGAEPYLAEYRCLRMSWACMQVQIKFGKLGRDGLHDRKFPIKRIFATYEDEKNGLLINWLASRPEPWIIMRLNNDQTAIEQSSQLSAIITARGWPMDPKLVKLLPHGEEGVCTTKDVDRFDVYHWKPMPYPANDIPAGRSVLTEEWAAPSRVLQNFTGVLASGQSRTCSYYSVLRPQRVLQVELGKYLPAMDKHQSIIGMHLRSGFADWANLNKVGSGKEMRRNQALEHAMDSPKLSYAQHWRYFDSMLLDCADERHAIGTPCFDWRMNLKHHSPRLRDGIRMCSKESQSISELANHFSLEMPSNGVLSAALACAALLGERGGEKENWGLLVLGDSPGFISLMRSHPQLRGKVVDTSESGSIGHTSFDTTCSQGNQDGGCQVGVGTPNPAGVWTRAMTDFYLGGLTRGFVSVLFSSWSGAMLSRSLLCCGNHGRGHRHFGAMYNRSFSHRDRSMPNELFLRAITQTEEHETDTSKWGRNNRRRRRLR